MSAPNHPVTRRHALKTIAAASLGAGLTGDRAAQAATTTKPTLHRYDNYAWLRGFSVVPSWRAH